MVQPNQEKGGRRGGGGGVNPLGGWEKAEHVGSTEKLERKEGGQGGVKNVDSKGIQGRLSKCKQKKPAKICRGGKRSPGQKARKVLIAKRKKKEQNLGGGFGRGLPRSEINVKRWFRSCVFEKPRRRQKK